MPMVTLTSIEKERIVELILKGGTTKSAKLAVIAAKMKRNWKQKMKAKENEKAMKALRDKKIMPPPRDRFRGFPRALRTGLQS